MIDNNENPSIFPVGIEDRVINAVMAQHTNEWRIFRMDFKWAENDLVCFAYLTDGHQVILDGCYCGHPGCFDDPSLPIVTDLKLQSGPDPTFIAASLSIARLISLNEATVIVVQKNGFHRYQRLQGFLTFIEQDSLVYLGKVQYGGEVKYLKFTNNNALTPKTDSYAVNIDGNDYHFERGERIVLLPL